LNTAFPVAERREERKMLHPIVPWERRGEEKGVAKALLWLRQAAGHLATSNRTDPRKKIGRGGGLLLLIDAGGEKL